MRFFKTLFRAPNRISLMLLSLLCLSLSGCLLLAVGGGAAAGGYLLAEKSADKQRAADRASDSPSTTPSGDK